MPHCDLRRRSNDSTVRHPRCPAGRWQKSASLYKTLRATVLPRGTRVQSLEDKAFFDWLFQAMHRPRFATRHPGSDDP